MSRSLNPRAGLRRCLRVTAISPVKLFFEPQALTILDEDGETVLDKKRGIEDDQAKAQGQHIVTCPDFEEVSYAFLRGIRALKHIGDGRGGGWEMC